MTRPLWTELVIGSTLSGKTNNLITKLNILRAAKEGKTFTVIDEANELKGMVKELESIVKVIDLGDDRIKYIFNPLEDLQDLK